MFEKIKGTNAGLVYTKNTEHLVSTISRECMLPIYKSNVQVFASSEICVSVFQNLDTAVLLASTITNDDWMELFFLLDALRDVEKIILCMPYCGYLRQNHVDQLTSRGAFVLQRFLASFHNVQHCILVDAHTEQTSTISASHLHFATQICDDIKSISDDCVIVSPDFGGIYRCKNVADSINADIAIFNKKRNVFGNLVDVSLIGNVKNRHCIIVDDIVDSGATICATAEKLIAVGAKDVRAYVTHVLLNCGAIKNIENSPICDVVISNTLHLHDVLPEKFRVISINSLIIETIRSIVR